MKKLISCILIPLLIISNFSFVFAGENEKVDGRDLEIIGILMVIGGVSYALLSEEYTETPSGIRVYDEEKNNKKKKIGYGIALGGCILGFIGAVIGNPEKNTFLNYAKKVPLKLNWDSDEISLGYKYHF